MSDTSRKIDAPENLIPGNASKPFESAIIPDSFWLGGLKIDVAFDENFYKTRKIVGEAQYPTQKIILDTTIMSKQSVEQNFHHEMVHWILYMMNEDELRTNEKFVDLFAHFLYQARATENRKVSAAQNNDGPSSQQGE